MGIEKLDINSNQLEFAVFCIENLAERTEKPAPLMYEELNNSGILTQYIIKNYDILHTQGKEYILDDILQTMKDWKK